MAHLVIREASMLSMSELGEGAKFGHALRKGKPTGVTASDKSRESRFARLVRQTGLPMASSTTLTLEERIHVLNELTDGDLLEADGLFPLALMAAAHVVMERKLLDEGKMPEGLPLLLAMDPKALRGLCKLRGLREEESQRLERWAEWARSKERRTLEDFFRRSLSK